MKKSIFLLACLIFWYCAVSQTVWTRKADFQGQSRIYHVGFAIGNKCYIGTGKYRDDSQDCINDFWEWDAITNTWTQKANFPVSCANAIAFSIGGKGYIATGLDSYQGYNGLYEYDPMTNSWIGKGSVPGPPRGNATCFTIGSKAYIGMGSTHEATVLQDFWEWDQPSNTWTQKADYPGGPRMNALGFSIGSKGYIGAGADAYHKQKDFWEWDQTTNTWTPKADFPIAEMNLSAFSIGNNGYAGISCCNGTNHYYDTSKFWKWDAITNIWSETESFTGVPAGNIGFSNSTKGFVGIGGGMAGLQFWEFDPNSVAQVVEKYDQGALTVFPNPTASELTIDFISPKSDNLTISIKNALGEIVFTNAEKNCSGLYHRVISLEHQTKGMYFIELIYGSQIKTEKIIVE